MKVALFITCLADLFYPEVGKSVVQVLERQGVEVDVPLAQTCCGQPAYNSGYQAEGREAARHFVRTFAPYLADGWFIVLPSGSCAAMIREVYPKLLADEPALMEMLTRIRERVYEFSEFLVHVLGVENISATYKATATVHHSCHMSRGLGLREEPLKVLAQVEGLELVPLPNAEDCCGFGGTFAVKMPQISTAMGEEKLRHIDETGADLVVASDLGCLMHLSGLARRQGRPIVCKHVAQILAEGGDRRGVNATGDNAKGRTCGTRTSC